MSELKRGWKRVKFGQVVRLNKDKSKDPEADGLERFVGLEHIEPGDLQVRSWGNVTDGTSFTNRFRPGQVLFGKRRAYQRKVAVAEFEGVCSGDIYVLESKSEELLLPELLPFVCQTDAFFQHAMETSAGSLSPRTNWKSLADYEFALPSVGEQERIVRALHRSAEIVAAHQAVVEHALAARLALVKDFSSSLEDVPMTTLDSATDEIEAGKSPSGENRPAMAGECGVLKVSAVGDWDFVPHENKRISPEDFLSQRSLGEGDLLVARANADPSSVGRTCLVRGCFENLMLSDKTWRLRPTREYATLTFGLLGWSKSPPFRREVRSKLGGTEAKNISQAKLLSCKVPLPDEAFAAFDWQLREMCLAIDNARRRVETSVRLHRSLLTEVMG